MSVDLLGPPMGSAPPTPRRDDEAPARPALIRRALAAVARNGAIRRLVVSTPVMRDLAWRFVAGEDLAAGLAVVRALHARGIAASLSHVGTHVRDRAAASAAADEAVRALAAIHDAGLDTSFSLKLTQIGLDVDPSLCRELLFRILDEARRSGVFVRIDMEESRYVDATIALFEEAQDRYGPEQVGIVLQSYLRERRDDLPRLLARRSRIRLVKGGYWEAPGVVLTSGRDIDRAFLADIDTLLRAGEHPAIATHDRAAIDAARRIAAEVGREPRSFEFQLLYGVRPDLQRALVRAGFAVRCYVPYGGDWYSYVLGCLRRVPEGALGRLRSAFLRRRRRARPRG